MNGILHIYWTKKTSTNSGKIQKGFTIIKIIQTKLINLFVQSLEKTLVLDMLGHFCQLIFVDKRIVPRDKSRNKQ